MGVVRGVVCRVVLGVGRVSVYSAERGSVLSTFPLRSVLTRHNKVFQYHVSISVAGSNEFRAH